MPTFDEQCLRQVMHTQCDRDPDLGSALLTYLDRLNRGDFSSEWVNAIFQKLQFGPADIYDAYALLRADAMLAEGKLAMTTIWVGETPSKDAHDEANNAVLSDLPEPFTGEFCGGRNYTFDGHVGWSEPVPFSWYPNGIDEPYADIMMPATAVSLEVGTTASSKTLAHLLYERGAGWRGVARWPYGSEWITLMARVHDTLQIRERGWATENSAWGQ